MGLSINGQGGGSSVAAADITDAGAAGVSVLQAATAAGARDAIDAAGLVSESGFTGAEWTLYNGGGACSAALNGSDLRLVLAAGSFGRSSGTYTGPCAHRAIGPTDTVDVAIRVSAINTGISQTQVTLELWETDTGATGKRVSVVGENNGTLYLFEQSAATVVYSGSVLTYTGGQLWIRLRIVAGVCYPYYGTGSAGALPTSWTLAGASVYTGLQGRVWKRLAVGAVAVSSGSVQTIDVAALQSIALSAASL